MFTSALETKPQNSKMNQYKLVLGIAEIEATSAAIDPPVVLRIETV